MPYALPLLRGRRPVRLMPGPVRGLVAALCLGLALGACAAVPAPASGTPSLAQAAAPSIPEGAAPSAAVQDEAGQAAQHSLRLLHGAVGTADCSSDAQCRTVAVGAQACGGPVAYLAWSIAASASAQVPALAVRYRDQQIALNAASAQMSTCRALRDPGAYCALPASGPAAGGHCMLRPDSGAGDPR